MALAKLNGVATKIIISLLLVVVGFGMNHVFGSIDGKIDANTVSIGKNSTNIDSLSIQFGRFMSGYKESNANRKEQLDDIKDDLKDIKKILDEMRFARP